jgi:hypothetical protein
LVHLLAALVVEAAKLVVRPGQLLWARGLPHYLGTVFFRVLTPPFSVVRLAHLVEATWVMVEMEVPALTAVSPAVVVPAVAVVAVIPPVLLLLLLAELQQVLGLLALTGVVPALALVVLAVRAFLAELQTVALVGQLVQQVVAVAVAVAAL